MSLENRPFGASFFAFSLRLLAVLPLWLLFWGIPAFAEDQNFGSVIDPDAYIIGPGDRFRIDFWDGSTDRLEVSVTPEGFVLITSMGRVDIGGLSLSQAKRELRNLIEEYYADIDFSISLVGVRSIKVLVTGGVAKPGLYEGFVSQRISEFIEKAGGFIEGSSKRNILLVDGGREEAVDILRFERSGDFMANPYMYSGNKIRVPFIGDSTTFIQIAGEVVNPGGYEYREGDNLAIMVELAMGFTGLQGDSVSIFRMKEGGYESIVLPIKALESEVAPGDKIVIRRSSREFTQDFYSITGMVVIPGRYPYYRGLNLTQALNSAGGLAEKADIFSMVIYRRPEFSRSRAAQEALISASPNNVVFSEKREPVSVDMAQFYPDRLDEVAIFPGDSLFIPLKTGFVRVYGMVNRPGVVTGEFGGWRSARYFIDMAGGYSKPADKGLVQIIRKGSGVKIGTEPGISVFDGDTIIVPEKRRGPGFWEQVKNISMILGGAAVIYLAIDKATE